MLEMGINYSPAFYSLVILITSLPQTVNPHDNYLLGTTAGEKKYFAQRRGFNVKQYPR